MYKISIITINYNNKAGLINTIKSVYSQSWQDFEYIIIDGNSTDGGKEVILEYAHKLNYYVIEPDTGIYNAMNKGIKAAKGEFLLFLNSGDTLFNENVLKNIEMNFSKTYDFYYGDYIQVGNDSKVKIIFPEKLSFTFFYLSTLCHQATFIRRSLFYDHFFYNEEYKIASDWEFFIYCICYKQVPYKYLGQTIANFDFNGISSTGKFKHISNEERIKTLEKYFLLFSSDYEFMSNFGLIRIQQLINIKKYPLALKALKACIILISKFIPKIKNDKFLIVDKKEILKNKKDET